MWGTGHQLVTVAQGYLLFEMTGSTLWLAALGAAISSVAIPGVPSTSPAAGQLERCSILTSSTSATAR